MVFSRYVPPTLLLQPPPGTLSLFLDDGPVVSCENPRVMVARLRGFPISVPPGGAVSGRRMFFPPGRSPLSRKFVCPLRLVPDFSGPFVAGMFFSCGAFGVRANRPFLFLVRLLSCFGLKLFYSV